MPSFDRTSTYQFHEKIPLFNEEIPEDDLVSYSDVTGKNIDISAEEETPEINTAILEVAKYDEAIDLKAVALGAYLSYRLIETAVENDSLAIED